MEETISLQELFKALRKRFILIISLAILAVTIAGVVSYFFLTPIYEASALILVNQQQKERNQFNSEDIEMNLQLIDTYNVIIKSPAILSKVIEHLELDTTPALLEKKIKVTNAQNSQVVNISVQDPDPQKAVDVANTTVEVFQKEIRTLMNVDNIKILSPAALVKNQSPVKPKPIIIMAIAAITGLMMGVGIAFLLNYLDMTIKTEQDIEELLDLPILGFVSPILEKDIDRKKELLGRRWKRRQKDV